MRPTDARTADILVRPAVTADLEDLVALLLVTRRAAEPDIPPVRQDAAAVRAFLESRIVIGDVWVALDEQVAGFAVITRDWLHSLYVGPQHQGQGIGTLLLDLVKAQRPDGFGLWVFAANEPARGFYRRHGLLELEHTDGSRNEEGAPDIRMVWPGERPLAGLRRWIDEVDADLAELLARRFALTAAVQGEKRRAGEPAGHAGRDPGREREIVERMVAHSPGLDADRIGRVMGTIIGESLEEWQRRPD